MEYKILKGNDNFNEKKYSNDLTYQFNSFSKQKLSTHNHVTSSIPPPKYEFLRITSQISNKMTSIATDLLTMRESLKSASFFMNNDDKINNLIVKIKENLSDVQTAIATFNNSDHDFKYSSQSESFSKIVLETLQVRALKSAEDFQKALQMRAQDMKKREDKTLSYKSSMNNPSKAISENLRNRPMFLEKERDMEKERDETDLKYKRDFKKIDQNRSESIKNIEKLLHDVASTFHRLGSMVKIHEVMIDRIDKDVDHTILNVNKGKDHLIKHYDNVRSNKGTIIRVVIILMIFSVFYIIFLL